MQWCRIRFANLLEFQQTDGRFITNPYQENVTFLHPHLYTRVKASYIVESGTPT
jgi:hypothetical protein